VEGRTWLPFSTGSRQCIGMNFSLNEQRVMLSMLCKSSYKTNSNTVSLLTSFLFIIVRKFTWSTPENSKHKNGVVAPGQLVISPDQLDITFHKRY
jgi:hypothetical protein